MTDHTSAAPPTFARIADAATVVLLVTTAWILATGGTRFLVGGVVISLRSAWLFLYIAAAVQIVRHLLVPSPAAWSRLGGWWERLVAREGVAAAVGPFMATRMAVLLAGFFAVIAFGLTPKPGFVLSHDPLANLPARFDAGWYGDIALDGYHWDFQFQRQRNIAFFPALPLLMRPVGVILGGTDRTAPRERRMLRMLWGGVIVSLAAFLVALWYMVRLGDDLFGPGHGAAAALLLAAYPFSYFYGAPYTESLFLLGAAGAWYHFRRGEWVTASALGLLAGLSRPNGCFLSVPLGLLALQHAWTLARERGGTIDAAVIKPALVRLLVAAMPGLGMLAFTLYLYRLTGVWFAWARSHEAWGRTFHGLEPFVTAFGWLRNEPWIQVVTNIPFNTLNTLGLLFALALVVPVFRRLGFAWGIFVVVNVALPVFAGGVLSMGRLTSTLFPLFLALAAILPARAVPSWAAAFGVMQGLGAALFFTWRELF